MITAVQIENFKGIRSTPRIDLSAFHVLVGPNGSGKSTFLDAIEFVKACLLVGTRKAVETRVPEFRDLTFMRRGGEVSISLWLDLSEQLTEETGTRLKYSFAIVADEKLGVRVSQEVLEREGKPRTIKLLGKTRTGTNFYRRETGTYQDVFAFGADALALSVTNPDTTKYPTGNAVKNFLMHGVRFIQLNSPAMRQPALATRSTELDLDGTNLARVVGRLARSANKADRKALAAWIDHLSYALDDIESVHWAARAPDNAEYIVLRYNSGLECPSWLLSDGTLRMLALTLPAFLPPEQGVYMVEEPENGVHPKALEIILSALKSIPMAQVFVATHSPLVVQQAGPEALLCFARDDRGVRLIRGSKHGALKNWNGVPELSSIFASRVLG